MPDIKAEYVAHMGTDLTIVNSARVSFNKQVDELSSKDEKLIRYLYKNDHMSTFEHCSATMRIHCPIYISKQIMRHRTFSFNELSRRYTSEEIEFYNPHEFRKQSTNNRQASEGVFDARTNERLRIQHDIIHTKSLDIYNNLLKMGVCREQARGILPQNLMTKFYMTGNLRNWIHFIKLRRTHDAQGEIRTIADQVTDILSRLYPVAMEVLLNG